MFAPSITSVIDEVDNLRHHVDDHWQIPRDEAQLLAQLVRAARCKSICEIGMSYGFSTLHLAAATAQCHGHVHSFEIDPRKIERTAASLTKANLADTVTQHLGDARQTVSQTTPDAPYDFVFIDAVKDQSRAYLDAVWDKLAPDVMLVTDNTLTHPDQLAPFVAHLRSLEHCTSCQIPVGNGVELTIRRQP